MTLLINRLHTLNLSVLIYLVHRTQFQIVEQSILLKMNNKILILKLYHKIMLTIILMLKEVGKLLIKRIYKYNLDQVQQ